jgi:hypothetical protein
MKALAEVGARSLGQRVLAVHTGMTTWMVVDTKRK